MHVQVLLGILFASTLVACSNDECGPGELRVGTGCRVLPDANIGARDGNVVQGERANEGDGGSTDGHVDAAAEGEAPVGSGDAAQSAPPLAPFPTCGNGVVEPAKGETCEPNTAVSCPTICDDKDPCTTDIVVGGESTCNAACEHRLLLPSLEQADECCPADADANTDQDCSPMCGNGIVEQGERCDGNCPTQGTCEDDNPCTVDVLNGTGCGRYCSRGPSQGRADDGCCLTGETWIDDSACPHVYGCGNSCPDADDPATPGDDRAGYIRCGSVSCSSGTYCFLPVGSATPECREKLGVNLAICDGMEDCPSGLFCYQVGGEVVSASGGAWCGKETPGVGKQTSECHRDADCGSDTMECVPHPRPNRPWPVSWCALK